MPANSQPLFRKTRALFFGGVAALAALVMVATFIALSHMHDAVEKRVFSDTQSMARSMEQTVEGLIATIDVALLASASEISRQIATQKPDRHAIERMLRQQDTRLHQVALLRSTNERGEVVYVADDLPTRPNNADREYFVRLRDDPRAGLVISEPVIGRSNQKWSWIFARRISKADGSFGGAVFASVPVDEIHQMFGKIKSGSSGVIALRHANGEVVARYSSGQYFYPGDDKGISASLANALRANPAEGSYAVKGSRFDGIARLYSYSRNEKYGFLVTVGIDQATAFAEWHKEAWIFVGLAAAFILTLFAFAKLINRGWRQQEEAMSSLYSSQESLREAQKIALLSSYSHDFRNDRWAGSGTIGEILGLDDDYPIGAQEWLNLIAPEHREAVRANLREAIEKRLPFDQEYPVIAPGSGQKRWVHHKITVKIDAEGNPVSTFGTIQDITERKQAEVSLRESEEQFRIIAASAQDAIVMMGADGTISFWNRAAELIFGYASDEAIGNNLHSLLAPERYRPAFEAGFARYQTSGEGAAAGRMLELQALRKGGAEFPMELSLSAVRRRNEWIAIGIIRDISERKKAEQALQESHEALQSILQTTLDGFWRVDGLGNLLEVNQTYCDMSGFTREELLAMRIPDLEAMLSPYEVSDRIQRIFKQGHAQFETMHRRKDGSIWRVEVSTAFSSLSGGQIFVFIRDITERKRLQDELLQFATIDEMTGAINRRHFMLLARNEHRRAVRLQQEMTLVLIDLDYLKPINDVHGHSVGDLALQLLVRVFQQSIRGIDIFARLGGDEFVLLLPGASSEQAREVVDRALRKMAAQPISYEGHSVAITASVGIASLSSDDDTLDLLISRADHAMYLAKQSGRNRVIIS